MNTQWQTQVKANSTLMPPFASAQSGLLQRQCACGQHTIAGGECTECQKKRLQRKAAGYSEPETVPSIVHEVLRSPGQPLDPATRAFMEPRFGHDFSRVRVHTDVKAAESARAVNALAYTVGRDVVFGAGQYTPGTSAGKQLLAHELAHTIQQSRGGLSPGLDPDSSHEQQANASATAFASGQPVIAVVGATGVGIARQQQPRPEPLQPLTPEELLDIIVRERAFTFSRGGQVVEDPRGEGRGVGPAAGGRAAGSSVFAVIQVTDSQGNVIARSRGEYVQHLQRIFGTEHAEPRAIRALEPALQVAGARVRGGSMLVVLDQEPCGADRADCATNLRNFAQRYGLGLDVRVPTRSYVRDPGREVRPRAAAQGAQRADLQARPETQVRLRRLESLSITPPRGGTPRTSGGGVPPTTPPRTGGTGTQATSPSRRDTTASVGTPDMRLPQVGGPSPRGQAIAGGITLAFQGANFILNWINDEIQARRVREALAAIESSIAGARRRYPDQGTLLLFFYTQVQAPPESLIRPGVVFSHLETATGRTQDEAEDRWRSTPAIRAGTGPHVERSIQRVWIPPAQPASVTVLRTPFPRVAVATFAAGRAVLQDVEWGGLTGFDDEGTTALSVSVGATPEFLILQVPARLHWFFQGIHTTNIPVENRPAAQGGDVPVVNLDPVIPFGNVAAACVFPANGVAEALFSRARATQDNLNHLRGHVNFGQVRWVRPENIRVLRRL